MREPLGLDAEEHEPDLQAVVEVARDPEPHPVAGPHDPAAGAAQLRLAGQQLRRQALAAQRQRDDLRRLGDGAGVRVGRVVGDRPHQLVPHPHRLDAAARGSADRQFHGGPVASTKAERSRTQYASVSVGSPRARASASAIGGPSGPDPSQIASSSASAVGAKAPRRVAPRKITGTPAIAAICSSPTSRAGTPSSPRSRIVLRGIRPATTSP